MRGVLSSRDVQPEGAEPVMKLRWAVGFFAACLGAATGCAQRPATTELPNRVTPELVAARDAARRGDSPEAERLYRSLLSNPTDAVVRDLALLELGQVYYDQDECARAEPLATRAAQSTERPLVLRATLLHGVCRFRQDDEVQALEVLTPLLEERLREEERQLLWDTLLLASEDQISSAQAAITLGAVIEHQPSHPVDARARDLLALALQERLPLEEVQRLYEEHPETTVIWQAAAARLLREAIDGADATASAALLERMRGTRPRGDVDEWNALVKRADLFLQGNPFAVGVLLPLSGRGREVGDRLLRGIRIAAANDPAGPELLIRDTASDPEQAKRATEELLRDHQVISILGPVGSATSRAAAVTAKSAGVPLITFSADQTIAEQGDHVFRFFFTPAEELHALVQVARKKGLQRFVVLHPSHRYGRALRDRFEAEVRSAGGQVCSAVEYPDGTKSFSPYALDVISQQCRAVLVADVASRVAIVAPTFAAEGAWAAPSDVSVKKDKSLVTFVLPSLAWSDSVGRAESRYLQGSLVARPYDPDAAGSENDRFRVGYESQYGTAADMFAAYGHDAYRLLSFAIASGAATRPQLRRALVEVTLSRGLTAASGFSRARNPASMPRVFEYIEDALLPAD